MFANFRQSHASFFNLHPLPWNGQIERLSQIMFVLLLTLSSTVMAVWYQILVGVEDRKWGAGVQTITGASEGVGRELTVIAPPPGNTLGLKERSVLEWWFPADDLQMPLEAFHQQRLEGGVHLIAKAPVEVCQAKVPTSAMFSHQRCDLTAKRNYLNFPALLTDTSPGLQHSFLWDKICARSDGN